MLYKLVDKGHKLIQCYLILVSSILIMRDGYNFNLVMLGDHLCMFTILTKKVSDKIIYNRKNKIIAKQYILASTYVNCIFTTSLGQESMSLANFITQMLKP